MTERMVMAANKYGPMAAVGLFLVYWLASDVTGQLDRLQRDLAGFSTSMTAALDRHSSETGNLLFAICLNSADTAVEIARCQGH